MRKKREKGILIYEFDTKDYQNGMILKQIREIKEKYIKRGLDIELTQTDAGIHKIVIDTRQRNEPNKDNLVNTKRKGDKRGFFRRALRFELSEKEKNINFHTDINYGNYSYCKNYQQYKKDMSR